MAVIFLMFRTVTKFSICSFLKYLADVTIKLFLRINFHFFSTPIIPSVSLFFSATLSLSSSPLLSPYFFLCHSVCLSSFLSSWLSLCLSTCLFSCLPLPLSHSHSLSFSSLLSNTLFLFLTFFHLFSSSLLFRSFVWVDGPFFALEVYRIHGSWTRWESIWRWEWQRG